MDTYPGVIARPVQQLEDAVIGCDVVNVATSGAVSPEIPDHWLKEGVLLTLPASAGISKTMMTQSTILVDNWKMYEAYAQELAGLPGGIMDGMPIEDVAWGYEIYQNAQIQGIGTTLNLWE